VNPSMTRLKSTPCHKLTDPMHCLQAVLESTFQFTIQDYFTCQPKGHSRLLVSQPGWVLHLSICATLEASLEDFFWGEKLGSEVPCASEACGKVPGSIARRLKRLPPTLLISLKRTGGVRA